MEDWKIEKYIVVGKGRKHAEKIEETLDIIINIMDIIQSPYVACSFGKDSAVMAHIILCIYPYIPLRFLSSGETRIMHPNIDAVIDYFEKKFNANIHEINIDRVFSEGWENASWDEQRRAGKRDFANYLGDDSCDCVFMGLRAQESKRRAHSIYTLKTVGLPRFCYKYKEKELIRCCPIARWTTEDVGAYILKHGIPYLKWYDTDGFEGRTTARLTRAAVEMGSLSWIQRYNKRGWNKLVGRFPEFKNMT